MLKSFFTSALLVLFVSLLHHTIHAQAGKPIPLDPTVRIGKLPNGLTYYIKANKKPENRAELRMAVKSGSMQEDPDQLGIAHFVEHMAFNGSKNFSKNELVDYLETIGSRFGPDLNAYTSFDETVYMLQVRTDEKEHFEKGMLILRDWSEGVSFDGEEIDKERGVVISEWRSRLSAEQRMMQEYLPMMYYQSRYADRLPIGDPEIVQTVSYDAVRRYYKDWYRPDLMAVFVVGDVDVDAIEAKIKSQFGDITGPSVLRKKEEVSFPPHEATLARVITDPEASNSRVQIIYKHTFEPIMDQSGYKQRLIHSLYNRMLGNRLDEISRESDPPYIFAYTGYSQDVGTLATYSGVAMTEAKNVKRAYETLLRENQRILQHGFTQTELDREKAAIMLETEQNVLEQDKQESSRLVQRLVYHFLEDNPIPDPTQHRDMYKAMIPTITLADVNKLASQWITDRNNVVLVTGPSKDTALMPDSVELIRIMKEIKSMKFPAYADIDVSAPLLTGSFPVRPPLNVKHNAVLDIYEWEFANGVRVVAKSTDFKNDEILMNAYSPGGTSLYSDAQFPSARSVSSIVGSSGVGPYNETGLMKKLSSQRVNVSPFLFEAYEGFNGSSSVKDIETMMQLIYSYATAYREDTTAFNAYLSGERTYFGNLLANPNNWFNDKVNKILYQNHPRRGFPSLESYDQVKRKEVMDIYKDRFRDFSDFDFFFVGNFDPDSLQRLTSRYLGALPGAGRKENWKDIGVRMPSGVIDSVYTRGEAPRSLVQLIYHGEMPYDPDSAFVLQSLIDIANIKLREELREDQGGVYGVGIWGSLSKYPIGQYTIRISFNTDPSRTKELTDAARKVIDELRMNIEQGDIVKISEAQRQSRVKDLKQNQFWMSSLINSYMNQVELESLVQAEVLEKRLSRLNASVLKHAARKYFNEKEVISVVMLPKSKS